MKYRLPKLAGLLPPLLLSPLLVCVALGQEAPPASDLSPIEGSSLYGPSDAGVFEDAAAGAIDAARADVALPSTEPVLPVPAPVPEQGLAAPMETPLAPAAPSESTPIEVTVRGASVAQRMESSVESVQVVDLTTGRRQSADLGELLARTNGIGVRRSGGLGSDQRISIGGFEGDQVRVFVDGLPIEFAGFGSGIGNIPTSLLSRVEIYRGVVPIRFGANALGGAINVVTRAPTRGTGGYASLQLGSFGTTRAATGAYHLDAPTGLLTRANAFVDYAKNDYPIEVEQGNAEGGVSTTKVYRKHDEYRAAGGGIDVGFVRRSWAERLMLKLFATGHANQIQSDLVQETPYGNAHYGGQNYGASLEYIQPLTDKLKLETLLGYGMRQLDFVDKGQWRYDWYGNRIRQLTKLGEIDTAPNTTYDDHSTEHGVFGRFNLAWDLAEGQTVRLVVAPSYTTRTGENRTVAPGSLDEFAADRKLLAFVNALEHELKLLDGRVENTLFGKSYLYVVRAREPLGNDNWRNRDRNNHRFGVGDSLRVNATDWLYLKAAYELATRLPRPDEVFGDGARIESNLALVAEHSHNTNLSAVLHDLRSPVGSFALQLHGFERRGQNLIALVGNTPQFAQYANLYRAHSRGVEATGNWSSPGGYVTLDGNVTYQSFRIDEGRGAYDSARGDRVPNRPYLYSNGTARGVLANIITEDDELSLSYYLRYVHSFYRGLESLGNAGPKQSIAMQLSHTLALTYLLRKGQKSYSFSMEAQNLGDARLFDNFGAQRPGRGYYSKISADF